LIPGQEGQPAMLPLSPLLGQSDEADPPDGGSEESALYLVQPVQQVKDFKSDVAVLEEGQTTARKVIEVNHPLHYGGYHFYQHSYDDVGGQYTILLVKSDSGLRLVYGGFLLLGAGVFWWCWARPALSRLGKRRSNGA